MKFIVIGFDSNACTITYEDSDRENGIGKVHVMDKSCGSGETAACSLDVVHGIIIEQTEKPVTCKACIKTVEYYKTINLKKGP